MSLYTGIYFANRIADHLRAAGYPGKVDLNRIAEVLDAYTSYRRARGGLSDWLKACGVWDPWCERYAYVIETAYRRSGGDWTAPEAVAVLLVAEHDITGGLKVDLSRVRIIADCLRKFDRGQLSAEGVRRRLDRCMWSRSSVGRGLRAAVVALCV